MKKFFAFSPLFLCAFVLAGQPACAQSAAQFGEDDIPLKKIILYSSGVAQYVHEGRVKGSGKADFLFSAQQINDVLKSLIIADSGAKDLTISYAAADTLKKALESLKINPAQTRSLFDILNSQRGSEIEVFAKEKITGKILSAESKGKREDAGVFFAASHDSFLSLVVQGKIHIIPFSEITSFKFTDEKTNKDLYAGLALISDAASDSLKTLSIHIDGSGERNIRLSYVMEAPVWKTSYRLDMQDTSASFQAWAIVDNSTDLDWKNVKLTLTGGRPVAFKQDLYAPYYVYRPTLPLLHAKGANPETYDSAYADLERSAGDYAAEYAKEEVAVSMMKMSNSYSAESTGETAYFEGKTEAFSLSEDLFVFTPVNPVNLERRQSTVIPVALAVLPIQKFSVFSALYAGTSSHPKFCVHMHNNSKLQFPAGAISVFGGGEYVGDAVLEFLPENEKHLIAYGDDLELTGTKSENNSRRIETVKLSGGVLTIDTKLINESVYTLKNSAKTARRIVVEHPINRQFSLVSEKDLWEKTAGSYRFKTEAEAGKEKKLMVREERITQSRQEILHMSNDFFISVIANKEMPADIKKSFEALIVRKNQVDAARKELQSLQSQRNTAASEQERARKNLEALGAESREGKEFSAKLMMLESRLEDFAEKISAAEKKLQKLDDEFVTYVNSLNIGNP